MELEEKEKEFKFSSNKIDLKTLSELKASKSHTLRPIKKKEIFPLNKMFHYFHNQTLISQLMIETSTSTQPFKQFRGKILYFIHYNNIFRRAINAIILFDIIILSIDNFPVNKSYSMTLETIDFTIFLIYCFEILIKIFAYGFKIYLANPFHLNDILLIILNIFQYSYQSHLASLSTNYSFEAVMLQYTLSGPFIKPAKAFRAFESMYYSRLFGSFAILFKAFLNSLIKMKSFFINSIILILIVSLIGKELFAYKIRIIEGGKWEMPVDL